MLSAQPQMQSSPAAELLRALVEARLVSNVTSTKRVAEGKRIFDFGQDVGFMMAKVSLQSVFFVLQVMQVALCRRLRHQWRIAWV